MAEPRVHTVADLELGNRAVRVSGGVDWRSLAAGRDAVAHVLDEDQALFDGRRGIEISFPIDGGALCDRASVVVPFDALAELVDAERARTAA